MTNATSPKSFTHPAFSLNVVQVGTPCSADWNAMQGNDRARHCGECNKNVYNLSAMTEQDALALIREKEGHLCIRFYRREDGTMLTQDCPVGLRAQLRAAWAKSVARVAAAAVFAVGFLGFGCSTRSGSLSTAGTPSAPAAAPVSSGGASAIGLEPAAPPPPAPMAMGKMVMGDYCPAPAPPPTPPTPAAPVSPAPAPGAPSVQ